MNIKESMNLAGRNLLNMLAAHRNYQPYWSIGVEEDYSAKMAWVGNIHNIGRWWDAILRLEEATGFSIPTHIEKAMLENIRQAFDNRDNLCFPPLNHPWWIGINSGLPITDHPKIEFHSHREGLLALNALVRYRDNNWAREQGHRMLETLFRITKPDCSWDMEKLDYYHRIGSPKVVQKRNPSMYELGMNEFGSANVMTNGRLIEALVWFYEATGDDLALVMADKYARYHLEHTTSSDGEFNNSSNATHAHSYLGTLRGLFLFGKLTNQQEYIDRVAMTYKVTVSKMVYESGFSCHDLWRDNPYRGEVGSTGDAVQLALWLAFYADHTELLDDVERIVKSRLLPAQIIESPELIPMEDEQTDEYYNSQRQGKVPMTNLTERIIGAIGGMQKYVQGGKRSVTDVTASALHTLVDVYNHIVTANDIDITVYLHFDYEDENVNMKIERNEKAKVEIVAKDNKNVRIRIPKWIPRESLIVKVNGQSIDPVIIGDFVYIAKGDKRNTIVLIHELPTRKSKETIGGVQATKFQKLLNQKFNEVRKTEEVEVEYTWKGDEIVGVYPNVDFFPFYPTSK